MFTLVPEINHIKCSALLIITTEIVESKWYPGLPHIISKYDGPKYVQRYPNENAHYFIRDTTIVKQC